MGKGLVAPGMAKSLAVFSPLRGVPVGFGIFGMGIAGTQGWDVEMWEWCGINVVPLFLAG